MSSELEPGYLPADKPSRPRLISAESLIYSIAFSCSIGAQAADLATTNLALQLGAEEFNPLLGGIYQISGFPGMSTYKALVAGLPLGIAECRKMRLGYKGPIRMLLLGDIATLGAATFNAAQMLHLR